jgi:SPP1 family predicted phage head-tail adaptor
MRSGKLDKTITIQRMGEPTYDDFGGVQDADYQDVATVRAELIQRSTTEFIQAQGANDKEIAVFKIRYLEGVSNTDIILFEDKSFNIREVAEIGRKRFLELRGEARYEG